MPPSTRSASGTAAATRARSFFNRAADPPQVAAEGVRRIAPALGEVLGEPRLVAQRLPRADAPCLLPFDPTDRPDRLEHLVHVRLRDEDDAVVVGEHDVVARDDRLAEAHRLVVPLVEPRRAERARAVAPDREADLAQLARVPVQSPDDDAGEPRGLRLEDRQIADARLVDAAGVVDDEDIAGIRSLARLEEDVDTAEVPGRQYASDDERAGDDRPDAGRSGTQRHADA